MNPQEQLDQDVVNLAKAIRSVETQGQKDPYTARGGSGEFGAYQYTKPTWEKATQKYYGKVIPLEQATKEQQNEIAYRQIKEFKDQGYNPGQIASLWNSGKPDAYLDPKYTGVNKYGVKYDVPKYAKAVATAYQSIKGNGEPTITPISPSTVGHEQRGTPDGQQPEKGVLGTNPNDSLYGKIIDNSITRGIQNFFPGKRIGEALGTLGGAAFVKGKDLIKGTDDFKNYDLSAPTPLQVAGDSAAALLTAGVGLPGKAVSVFGKAVPLMKTASTGAGRVAQATGLGAGFGATNSLADGDTSVKEIAKDTAIGAAAGGVIGTAGEAFRALGQWLPKRIAGSFIKTPANEDTIEYAVRKGLNSPKKMLADSDTSIKVLGSQLDKALKNPKYANVKVSGPQILDDVLAEFPDAQLGRDELIANLKRIAPLKAGTIDKLLTNQFTLKELHSLNSAIGKNTYKMAFDDPAVKAGKELGNAVYHKIGGIIKGTAKETVPLFDDLSKEYALNSALDRAIKRGLKAKAFTFFDLAAIIGGMHIGGPIGAGGVLVGEKILRSPTINLKGAGMISKLGGETAQQLQKGLQAPVLNATNGLIQQLRADRASQ